MTLVATYGQAIDGTYGLLGREDGSFDDDLFNPLNDGYYIKGNDPMGKGYRLQAWQVGMRVKHGEKGMLH